MSSEIREIKVKLIFFIMSYKFKIYFPILKQIGMNRMVVRWNSKFQNIPHRSGDNIP